MPRKALIVGLMGWAVIFGLAAAFADTAADSFAKGRALLEQGDFDAALTAYADAVRADRDNQQYLEQYALLRRVVQLRKSLAQEKEPARWEESAKALYSFYVIEGLKKEALKLAQDAHNRLANLWSVVSLAEAQLASDLNEEAVRTLLAFDSEKASPAGAALLGIALARTGQMERAKQIANSLSLGEEAQPEEVYAAARLRAVVGDHSAALQLLARCLQSLPPGRQASYKTHAAASPEFATVAGSPEFAKALSTPSKVPESKCSGGASCAGCPMRGKCAGSQGKQTP